MSTVGQFVQFSRKPPWRDRKLRRITEELQPTDLRKPGKSSRPINAVMIQGIALHDVYHAAQIQLLKRLRKKRRR